MRRIVRIVNNQQIGDNLKATTIVKFFAEQCPQYEIEAVFSNPSVLRENPYILKSKGVKVINENRDKKDEEVERFIVDTRQDDDKGKLDNPWSIHKLKENMTTFTQAMVGFINAKYGFELVKTQDEPDLHLSEEELKPYDDIPEKYWVVNTGYQKNNNRKEYPYNYWEKIFEAIDGSAFFIQNGNSKDVHKPFPNKHKNILNGIGIYDVRQTIRLIYHSQGVITPISWNMHCAAAFHKPCIVLAGGGEDVSWENYDYEDFHFLHTVGSFECCQYGGCWKSDCEHRISGMNACMKLIEPEIVVELIREYL